MKKLCFSVLVTLLINLTFAQGVSINPTGNNPDTSAMLDVGSTNKGFLVPRMTTAQRDAIPLPATGLLIFSTTTSTFDYYTGTVWVSLSTVSTTSTVPIIRTYTTNATWTKPPGLKYIIVEMVGGGGNGGNTSGADGGGGGGGGGYAKKLIAMTLLNQTEAIWVGLSGGTSSYGLHLQATGGSNANGQRGGLGGTGIGGDINIEGDDGSNADPSGNSTGGKGGCSILGGGGRAGLGNNSNGSNGRKYGGGGGGAHDDGTGNQFGGSGATGIVIVTEYY
jgi:hypothetical protein